MSNPSQPDIDWTPGPWRLSGPDMFGDYTIQPPTEELAIAAVVNGEMRRLSGEQAEHEANARLIAAAPTMADYIAKKAAQGDDEALELWRTINAAS